MITWQWSRPASRGLRLCSWVGITPVLHLCSIKYVFKLLEILFLSWPPTPVLFFASSSSKIQKTASLTILLQTYKCWVYLKHWCKHAMTFFALLQLRKCVAMTVLMLVCKVELYRHRLAWRHPLSLSEQKLNVFPPLT